MERKPLANTNRVFVDIEPLEEWVREQASDAFLVHLPGYKKENLKIQVTSARYVRVLGERPLGYGNKWERFRKEFPIPSNCDPNDVSAKFENSILSVKLPKMTPPAVDKKVPKTPTTEGPKPPAQEAPKPPAQEAPKPKPPTKEPPKPPDTEALKLPKPISTSGPQPQKPGVNNQEQIKKANGATSQGRDSNYAPPQIMDKDKSGDGLDKSAAKTTEKLDKDPGKKVEDSTKEELRRAIFEHSEDSAGVQKRSFSYNCKQVVDGLVMEMKQQSRKMVNLGLAFLFVLVLWLYLKHTIHSIREIKRQEL